ncbi:MAG: hypothetical protein AAB543_01380, partial [Pseudomonadota bacterium]
MDTAPISLLLAVIPFAVSSTFTPGPNNLMVMASAANFGYARTVPHMAGITAGFPLMVVGVGIGLAPLLERYPAAHVAMAMGVVCAENIAGVETIELDYPMLPRATYCQPQVASF